MALRAPKFGSQTTRIFIGRGAPQAVDKHDGITRTREVLPAHTATRAPRVETVHEHSFFDALFIYTGINGGMLCSSFKTGSVLQKSDISNATGKLIGQVEPTRKALSRRMRLRSLDRNQVMNALMVAMIA
jgi:hypothetical protein